MSARQSNRIVLPLQTRLDRLFNDVERRLSAHWEANASPEPGAARAEWRELPTDAQGRPLLWVERAGEQWSFQKLRKHVTVGTANPEISLSSLNEQEPGIEVLDDWARWTDCVVAGLQGPKKGNPIGVFTYSLDLKWDPGWEAGQPVNSLVIELGLHDTYVRPAHRGKGVMSAMAYELRTAYLGLIDELHPAIECFAAGKPVTVPTPVCANVVTDGGGAAARLVYDLMVEGLEDELHRSGWQRSRQRHNACAFRNGLVTLELQERFH